MGRFYQKVSGYNRRVPREDEDEDDDDDDDNKINFWC